MLILTRRVGEIIRVGDHITIMPVRIGDGKVRLGITAPLNVNIAREELLNPPPPAEAACDVDQPDEGGEGGGNR